MHSPTILAIDNGTQSVRAILFDLQGNIIAKNRVPIEPYFSIAPGLAEQDPQVFWDAVCQACQGLWHNLDQAGLLKESLIGVGLTTQRGTIINLDKNGQPLRPAIVWLDQRRTEGLPPIRGFWGLAFKSVGASETAAYLQAEAEANWIQTNQPEVWKKTHKYLFLSGYLTYQLTGKFIDSTGAQVGYMPFDYKRQSWSKPWDWKWQAAPVDPRMLPELVHPAEILGKITQKAADATGIPSGLPLFAAAADKACEVLGSGTFAPHIASLSYGTTATINTTHQRYIEVIPLIPPFPAAIPGNYSLEIQVYRGYWMVNWFKQEFGLREVQVAADQGIEPEALFDDLVNSVPPGSQGLILQPYWSPGLRTPGPEAKGSIIGFGDVHTRAHFYRAILEGLAYALREGAERTQKRTGIPITEIRVAGGGSQSDAAIQITADIFGLPTARPHIFEASGLGAAIDVAVGAEQYPDFPTAVQAMTRLGTVFQPDPKQHAIYEDLYQQVYKKMYQRLKPLYKAIRDITGYPKKY